MKGIDVSTLQGNIDWQRVADDGIDFAMIKATQGRGEGSITRHLRRFRDSQFAENIVGASAAGIQCGVYHYFTAQNATEARAEADYFCDALDPHKSRIKLWAAVDVESYTYLGSMSKYALTMAVRAFLDRVEQRGYKPMLYTNPDFLTYRLSESVRGDVDIWMAHYGVDKPMEVPRMQMWQYGTDTIDGINVEVDVNEGYFAPAPYYKVGGKYTISPSDVYTNDRPVPERLYGKEYTISQVWDDRILLREIASWVKI